MHSEMTLGGPGIYVGVVALLFIFVGAVFVLVDSLRRPRHHFGRLGRVSYVVVASSFIISIALALVVRFLGFGAQFAGTLVIAIAFLALLSTFTTVSYLLDVVFPPKEKLDARREIDGEPGATVLVSDVEWFDGGDAEEESR